MSPQSTRSVTSALTVLTLVPLILGYGPSWRPEIRTPTMQSGVGVTAGLA